VRIWKWSLLTQDEQELSIPAGARLLAVQTQHGTPMLWAMCDEEAQREPRWIAIVGTGNPLPNSLGEYLGTFQVNGGGLVFHVFERLKP
jgi:hypothetical protein